MTAVQTIEQTIEQTIDWAEPARGAPDGEVAAERRRQHRWPCRWPATVSVAGGGEARGDGAALHDMLITDASIGGFGLSIVVPANIDDMVVIVAEDIGTFRCRVAWKSDRASGVQILDNIESLSRSDIDALADALVDVSDAGDF